jgi:hypothetical protein
MKVKVQCDCGTRFEFEVEPVNERMPVPIACPGCNTDATARANAVIREKLAAQAPTPAPTPVPIPVQAPAPAPRVATVRQAAAPAAPAASQPPAPATQAGLRISKPHAAPAPAPAAASAPAATVAAPDEGAPRLCPKHKKEPAFESCVVCGKPICPKCMEQFGYLCSVYCKSQAASKRIYVPAYAHQKSAVEERSRGVGKLITTGVVLLLLSLAGAWIWYTFWGREPKVVYSLLLPKSDSSLRSSMRSDDFYELIGPDELLTIKNQQVSLMNVSESKSLWTMPLQSDAEQAAAKAARAKLDAVRQKGKNSRTAPDDMPDLSDVDFGDVFAYADPHVITTTNDIWISGSGRLARFDRNSGSRKEVPVKDKISNVTVGSDVILAVSKNADGQESLTRISLIDGSAQTEEIGASPKKSIVAQKGSATGTAKPDPALDSAKAAQSKAVGTAVATAQSGTVNTKRGHTSPAAAPAKPASADDEDMSDLFFEDRHPFIPAGPNVVQFSMQMLEHRTVSHTAMKPKGKSILEDKNLTAGQGLDLAQEMANDAARDLSGGEEIEDVSRYQVTLHRCFAKDTPDWTGEVVGVPEFIPLQTVDIVAAGQTLYAFNKSNKKLWEAKLTYPAGQRYETTRPPALESNGAVLFADLGMLTCFDLATGTVRWRKNSVGISHVQADSRGRIYVSSTTAGPDHIKYSLQVNIHEKIYPVILKLDPGTGKELWRQESLGDDYFLTGKFVYCTRRTSTMNVMRLEEGPDSQFNLNLVSPSSGNVIWNYHRTNRAVRKSEVQKNWILLQFADEVVVMKFFSL